MTARIIAKNMWPDCQHGAEGCDAGCRCGCPDCIDERSAAIDHAEHAARDIAAEYERAQ